MASNIVTTQWKKNRLFKSDNPLGNSILMDSSNDLGGNEAGLSPKALMLSSLAGCSGLDVVSILEKMKLIPDNLEIVVTAELTDEHPKIYNKVKVDYHFYGNLDKDKVEKAVNLSIDTYCGVMEMFRKFSDVTTEIHMH